MYVRDTRGFLVPAEIHTRQLIKSLIERPIEISKTLNCLGIDVGMTATLVLSWKITSNQLKYYNISLKKNRLK